MMNNTRPYVIVAPTYSSATEVRVLHHLCHELNSLGLDARLLLTTHGEQVPARQALNPKLHTPILNGLVPPDWDAHGSEAIFIYGDDAQGNPFKAQRVVRYVLTPETSAPEAGNTEGSNEYRLYYSRTFPTKRLATHPSLYLLPIDLGVFHDKSTEPREQDLVYLGKGLAHVQKLPAGAKLIPDEWLADEQQLAKELRHTRKLYSYEPMALVNVEAMLCGATVVLPHLSYEQWGWNRMNLDAMELTAGGLAFSDTAFDIDRAVRTRHEAVKNARYCIASFRQRLLDFVDTTQLKFK